MSDKWQPIKTAPKDGTQILAMDKYGQCVVVEFFERDDGSCNWETGHSETRGGFIRYFCNTPLIYWMPLPDPPKEKGR